LNARIVTALFGLPLLTASIWWGTPWFSLLLGVGGILGGREFYRLASHMGVKPWIYLGFAGIISLIIGAHFEQNICFFIITALIIISLTHTLVKGKNFDRWAWTVLGVLYLGWLLSYYILLREGNMGREWVFLAIFSVMAYDTGAFFVGRTWGRHFMAQGISPQKTWEGVAGGITFAVVLALVLSSIFNLYSSSLPLGTVQVIFLAILISLFSQLGDLAESWLKRKAQVKDSGSLLPGHGGILDRIDSWIPVAIVVYFYAKWTV